LREELRKWRKGIIIGRKDYIKRRREYREWCEKKKKA